MAPRFATKRCSESGVWVHVFQTQSGELKASTVARDIPPPQAGVRLAPDSAAHTATHCCELVGPPPAERRGQRGEEPAILRPTSTLAGSQVNPNP